MKTLIALTTAMALAASVFALKIPTGDNVRVADIKQNGEAIVEVTLGGENTGITTPVGAVQAQAGSTVYFYDKGALKELTAVEQDVTTPIGTLKVKDGGRVTFYESGALATLSTADQTVDLPPLAIEYYESGSPKAMYATADITINVNGVKYGCRGCYSTSVRFDYCPVYFYDSGSSDKWLVSSFLPKYYEENGTEVVSATYENALGKAEIALYGDDYRYGRVDRITFDKDGNVLSAPLFKSPDFTVKIDGQDVFIKGGKYKQTYWGKDGGKDEKDVFCNIAFYDGSTIKQCTLDELVITEVAGIKFTLPAGEEIFLWENGNIKQCYSSNPTKAKVKGAEYQLNEGGRCLFHRDGTLRAIAAGDDFFIDTFYSEGAPKRIIRYRDVYDAESDQGYVAAFITAKNYRVNINPDHLFAPSTYDSFYFQKGDSGRNISMVYFDDNDNPSSYTMLKLDKDGNYILDDEGVPIEDLKKKKFIKG